MARLWISDRSHPIGELSIEMILADAQRVEGRVASLAPLDVKLSRVAADIVEAARLAGERTRRMRSPLSLSKIRRYIFLFAIALLVWRVYAHYLQPRSVRVAVTAAESALLIQKAVRYNAEHIEFVESRGSLDSRDLVLGGDADLAVVQGGIKLPDNFNVMGVVRREHILFFVRGALPPGGSEPPHVITFTEGQGSQVLGEIFLELWGHPAAEWIHSWTKIAIDENYVIPSDAHIAFVVIDPADPTMQKAIRRIVGAGFRLRDPDIGIHATHLSYLNRIPVGKGYFHLNNPTVPAAAGLHSYVVDNYLVAARPLTYQQRLVIKRAFDLGSFEEGLAGTILLSRGLSLMANLDNVLAVGVNFVLIMVALLGIEIMLYRRYVHELNSLISCVSLLQAGHDLFGIKDKKTLEYSRAVLGSCADLLGLLSTIAAYYGKENAALMFNRYTTLIHTRANDLKINIQLKLLNTRFHEYEPENS